MQLYLRFQLESDDEIFSHTLIIPFLRSVARYPERPALWVRGKVYTYKELYDRAENVARVIKKHPDKRCVIFAEKTATAYISMLGALLAGKTYVPLRPRVPIERNLDIFLHIDSDLVIIDQNSIHEAENLFAKIEKKLTLFLPDSLAKSKWLEESSRFEVILMSDIFQYNPLVDLPEPEENQYAYLLFTSGSTGNPKGVIVKQSSALHYITAFIKRSKANQFDKFTQIADLTFDFSVHDCFVAWAVGAAVYSISEDYLIGVATLVQQHKITFWGSVPSVAVLLKQTGKLKLGAFPSIRYSMFCGEAFSYSLAREWKTAAPNSIIDNLYGPTEGTVAFTGHQVDLLELTDEKNNGVIPIGLPFPNLSVAVVDEKLNHVSGKEIGELCLAGPQIVDGYWKDHKLTEERFITFKDKDDTEKRWYKTGDMVSWSRSSELIYKGRRDEQIQIRGCRVEKMEIENAIKNNAQTEAVAVIPWPHGDDGVIFGIIAYVSKSAKSPDDLIRFCSTKFPDCMIPREVHVVDALPYNSNGKVDYLKLREMRLAMEG